jgi:aryl-alcohol dehydrogenase
MLELYSRGEFPVEKLVRVYPAREINQAIEDAEKGYTIKPVLMWD